jgi:NAD(P)-dependent dehydrogenase (short-subunit alcohol dehydrogenase family)
VITARSGEELKQTSDDIHAETGNACIPVICDVSKARDTENLVDAVRSQDGILFGLICAAGIYGAIGPFAETPFEEWEKAIDINLKGTARTIHSMYPFMKKGKNGKIVLFSGGGQGAMPNFSPYVTSKGGIWRLTETLAAEFACDHIYLNSIAPGAVNTKLLDELLIAGPERVGHGFYQKSIDQRDKGGESPEKAVDLCLYLLSEKSNGLYGKTISAIWDAYRKLENLEALSRTDMFCMRRVVDASGGTRGK